MAVESAADRAAFVNPDEFGATATYTPFGGVATALDGIFDNPSARSNPFGEADTVDARPTFLCLEADLPGAAEGGDEGDALVVNATTYKVVSIQPDGQGMALLMLRRAT